MASQRVGCRSGAIFVGATPFVAFRISFKDYGLYFQERRQAYAPQANAGLLEPAECCAEVGAERVIPTATARPAQDWNPYDYSLRGWPHGCRKSSRCLSAQRPGGPARWRTGR